MSPPTASASTGRLEDLSGAKVKRYEGSVVKSLSIKIVRIVFALLYDNARVFLQEWQRAQAPYHGPPPRVGCAPRGPCWAKIGLCFSWKIEIAFHFNSGLNFGN